jgi:hypothetical protein
MTEPNRRVAERADHLPEESRAGSDDPEAQAAAILEDSDRRTADRDAAPGTFVEHRTSDSVTDTPE